MQSTKTKPLDRIDLSILSTLQKNGRISNVNLANEVGLSASPCLDRVKRLENEGYIERYGAKLNASKLKFGMSAFIQITLDRTTTELFDSFQAAIAEIDQVCECHMVAGGFDYLVKIRIADMEAYRQVLGMIVDIPGVAKNHTYVVIEEIKQDHGLPLKLT
ncbi:winged helix-turn-helix transcriptional regulator [Psychrobium sp. 1_MG-2023]|uniref:winged helix-turn-helix transcriptional regulator n=1 Tax=Psychrobium sp. 1_MG-2023 TaxID=3062624 RepID=UPI000C34E824|nr:winged helix-turn-helix transcriptional regulator [Psychrobium sp. 1_MG-2023]MDP2560258.1 winged helix-turn-helix transcriptional regulator [Psychrobium sp. 1_MG-2023]PKF55376.1 leucine-responsive transcriptional regulator [Alteromonadales bacterium alter-6D02]